MKTLTITESKAQLSALVQEVLTTGRPITIGRAGKPMVQLVPYVPAATGRRLGAFRGQIQISADFDSWENGEAEALGVQD